MIFPLKLSITSIGSIRQESLDDAHHAVFVALGIGEPRDGLQILGTSESPTDQFLFERVSQWLAGQATG